MIGLDKAHKKIINDVLGDLFDDLAFNVIGDLPQFKGKKNIFITGEQPLYTLARIFLESHGGDVGEFEEKILHNNLDTALEYINKLKANTQNRVVNRLDGFVKTKQMKNETVSPEEMAVILDEEMKSAESQINTITNSEATKSRNTGKALEILKVAEDQNDEDPDTMFILTKDSVTCKECIRLHLMPDMVTPRVWKLSQLSHDYHKKGENFPSINGLHPHCFTDKKGVNILTENDGWKNISDVKIGERVLTHTGKFKKVLGNLDSWKKRYHGTALSITYKYKGREGFKNFTLNVTPEHEFLTQRGWVRAEELTTKDSLQQLLAPCLNNCGNNIPVTVNSRHPNSHYCCKKCIAESQWKNPEHRANVSTKSSIQMKKFTSENRELTLERLKKANDKTKEMMANGEFWAQKPENLEKMQVNAAKLNKSFIDSNGSSKEEDRFFEIVKEIWPNAQRNIILKKWCIDFLLEEFKINIEYDGGGHYLPVYTKKHTMEGFLNKQKGRDNYLNKCGYHVLRYSQIPTKDVLIEDVTRLANNSNGTYVFDNVKIDKIKKLPDTRDGRRLYDLKVEDDESFVVNGVVSHNCRCTLTYLAPKFGFDHKGKVTYTGTEIEQEPLED